jgi:hypothetical protein
MKKILLISSICLTTFASKAQVGTDTLLYNDFNTDPFAYMQIMIPLGVPTDTTWYTFDIDGQPDGSNTARPGEWFWSVAYSDNDTVGNAGVMGSSSWTNSSVYTENILVTPSIYIGDTNAVLHWESAPRQTPRYLDGYQVLLAVGNNDPSAFTDTLFVASEYTSLDNSNFPANFGSYTFTPGPTSNPLSPFVHGMDSTYTEFDSASDSSRLIGRLRPFSVSLAAYSGQNVYVMFHHYCIDDNLIEVDNVLVTGTDFTGVQENNTGISFSTYPNPADDQVNIRFNLPVSSNVTLNIYDISGKLIRSENKGTLSGEQKLLLDVSQLNAGMYRIELITNSGTSNSKIIVR